MPDTGTFLWNELMSNDVEAAKAYYGTVHGWTAMDTEMPGGGTYTVFLLGKRPVAGMMDMKATNCQEGTPSHWFNYIAVADAHAAFTTAVESGATALREPFEVPGAGVLAILQAPDGSAIGLMQPGENWDKMEG